MHQIKNHIIFKWFTFILVLTLITPTLVKFGHVFEDHIHEVCTNNQQTHLHTLDIDCEFYKFKTSNSLTLPHFNFDVLNTNSESKTITGWLYNYKYNHKQLPFSLRGPPYLM